MVIHIKFKNKKYTFILFLQKNILILNEFFINFGSEGDKTLLPRKYAAVKRVKNMRIYKKNL